MDHSYTEEVELDFEIEDEADPVPIVETEPDPATEAFARLEGEMALMRRAVERLAAERADIIIPDYSTTLGEMAGQLSEMSQSLATIVSKPALQFTPKSMAERIEAASREARRTDNEQLADGRRELHQATQNMRALFGTVNTIAEQRRRLTWAAGGGLLAGVLLWSFLPGVVLRALPQSWHMPENMARHIVGELTLWDAGGRLMQAENPEAWRMLTRAAELLRVNRAAIEECRQVADRKDRTVPCTIRIDKGPGG